MIRSCVPQKIPTVPLLSIYSKSATQSLPFLAYAQLARRYTTTTKSTSKMANIPTEIPSLKLNDGTSIPVVCQYFTLLISANRTSSVMAVSTQLGKRSSTVDLISPPAGTAWYKKSAGDIDRTTVEAIKTAIKLGYYHLDGAEVYNTEPELGAAIKESGVPREKLFVTTKVITEINDIPKAIDASLKKLQLEYVNL